MFPSTLNMGTGAAFAILCILGKLYFLMNSFYAVMTNFLNICNVYLQSIQINLKDFFLTLLRG